MTRTTNARLAGLPLPARPKHPRAAGLLGEVDSILLAVLLPAQLAGLIASPVTELIWLPLAVFEVALGFWLLIKGVAMSEMG